MSSTNAFERLHPAVQHHVVNHYQWSSLRPVQEQAVGPILDGANAVILAPTAGGKTEAAFLPLLSMMLEERWSGLSVLYLSPIRALLNNQNQRLEELFRLVGRGVGVWHGDVSPSKKEKIRKERPDLLLTTPESLEAMLISTRTSPAAMFSDLRAVVIDEVHAFAGDDRGWHLIGVLDRIQRYAGRDLQRIGLSATVGNPNEIVNWLSAGSQRARITIDPPRPASIKPEVKVDWVGTLTNAAQIISKLHRHEKRLVFCDSRRQVEMLARELKERDVDVHLSHSSLGPEVRRQTERAFAESSEGVIVATSALELGIDIGDLDRVIQIDSPFSVASFLQRMGRTGRRRGTQPNCLFLCLTEPGLLRACAIVNLWKQGVVEPARAADQPYHIIAQQLLGVSLEKPGLIGQDLVERIATLGSVSGVSPAQVGGLLDHLLANGFLYMDSGRISMGHEGEETFGRRHFLDLVSVFTSPPMFTLMQAKREIGVVSSSTFDERDEGDHVVLLAGRTWRVLGLNWRKRIAHVEPVEAAGRVRFVGSAPDMNAQLARAHRDVLLGSDRGQSLWSKRANMAVTDLRAEYAFLHRDGVTCTAGDGAVEVWTFAGTKVNRVLAKALLELGWESAFPDGIRIKAKTAKTDAAQALEQTLATLQRDGLPSSSFGDDDVLLKGLKFNHMLSDELNQRAVAERFLDTMGARTCLQEKWCVVRVGVT